MIKNISLACSLTLVLFSGQSLAQVEGDAARGQALYTTCAACHGQNGEGMRALNSPKIAGQQAWYTIRQIENFKSGVRGSDARDVYGKQMAPMAQLLTTEQQIADVAAYIESLGN